MGGRFLDLTGQTFGRLTVINRADNIIVRADMQYACWNCVCECGKELKVRSADLNNGHTQSCGCLQKERIIESRTKHGGSRDRLYQGVWANMLQRCENPNSKDYKDYGGRGIKVCAEWHDYAGFRSWALKNGYTKSAEYMQCTLDRVNVDGDYTPENCRFVNSAVQSRNARTNLFISNGELRICLYDVSQLVGISYDAARQWYHDRGFRTLSQYEARANNVKAGRKPRFNQYVD